jgi:hypothetical protein
MPPLEELFTSHAVVKILDFLSLYKDFEYTRTDIAKETGISRRTLYEVFPIIERYELITVTKSIGNVKLYKLNTANVIARRMIALADAVALFRAEKSTGIELASNITTDECTSTQKTPVKVTMVQIEANSAEQIKEVMGEIRFPDGKILNQTKRSALDTTQTIELKQDYS